jgi:hypothetical protein
MPRRNAYSSNSWRHHTPTRLAAPTNDRKIGLVRDIDDSNLNHHLLTQDIHFFALPHHQQNGSLHRMSATALLSAGLSNARYA